MQNKFTQYAQNALNNASGAARNFGHTYVGSEHLLLGILMEKNCGAAKILENRGIMFENVRAQVLNMSGMGDKVDDEQIPLTPRTKSIITSSLYEAQSLFHNYIGTEHILMALLQENECVAIKILNAEGANIELIYNDILNYFSSQEYASSAKSMTGNDFIPGIGMPQFGMTGQFNTANPVNPNKKNINNTPVLNQYGKDLTMLAEQGKLDPIIGRDGEMERVVQILSRRTKNNPCLIGEPGVGKTAVVEGLAQRICEKNVPDTLINKRVVTLDLSGMIAGAKYRGEFEERLKNVMEEIKKSTNVIIFIDEIHTIIGAGAAEGAVDAANILKPALARGEIQVVGATTTDEYRRHVEKDAALERRFQSVMVGEPSEEETVEILKGLRDRYEAHHKVKISDEAIVSAVKLSKRYINDRYLPDKAIDLIDEAASKARISVLVLPVDLKELENQIKQLNSEKEEAIRSQDFERAAKVRDEAKNLQDLFITRQKEWVNKRDTSKISITEDNIADIVTAWTHIPVKQLLKEEADKLVNLEEALHKRIVGQNEAVNAIARAIRRSRVGLKDPKRPAGSFIFLGPTGVGKTEVCKALSETLFGDENSMIRVDMSEFMEKHSVSKLIGSPPGYVGYDDAGQLTEKIRKKPYSVILFDEIEKAHPDVFNILLQILEDGILTDAHGRKVDFKNTVLIMTSNVGADNFIGGGKLLGFTSKESGEQSDEIHKSKSLEALKSTFRPEFLNRIDEIITFAKLTNDEIKQITVKMLDEIKIRIRPMGVDIEFDEKCVDLLSKEGYDPIYGARPLRRAIQRKIEDTFALEMLENRIKKDDKVLVTVEDDNIKYNIKPAE
ncbi:MAG: ATP-dependent Clp protease ATP-binding subunit [Oscillospiraceae bacterium]|nr:ATP-dependent Clp protease ATP-binding subunit [Oscillospiraceae bacterium]